MKRVAMLVLLGLVNMEAAHSQQDSARPADFTFVLEYGSAKQLILDTTKGTFTRDADVPNLTTSVNLKLTADEMDQIFKGLARIDFWNDTKYPKLFSPPITLGPGPRMVTPCGSYSFSVTSSRRLKELRWEKACFLPPLTFRLTSFERSSNPSTGSSSRNQNTKLFRGLKHRPRI
jgi:hypothetical protein